MKKSAKWQQRYVTTSLSVLYSVKKFCVIGNKYFLLYIVNNKYVVCTLNLTFTRWISSICYLLKSPQIENIIFTLSLVLSICLLRIKSCYEEFHMSTWKAFAPFYLPYYLLSLVFSLPVPLTTAHPYLFVPHLISHAIMKCFCQKQEKNTVKHLIVLNMVQSKVSMHVR